VGDSYGRGDVSSSGACCEHYLFVAFMIDIGM